MALNPVVIAGSLSKEELEKSIREIVNAVDVGMNEVTDKFDTKLAAIEENFKKAGTKIGTAFKDSFNAALGGSFDQLAAAMEKVSNSASAAGGGAKGGKGTTGGSSGTTYEDDTIGALKAQIAELEKKINYEKLNTQELRDQVRLLKESKNLLQSQTTSVPQKLLNSGLQSTPKTLQDAIDKLDYLNTLQSRYKGTTALSVQEQNKLTRAIAQTEKQIERMKSKAPKTLKEVMGMDESSVDAIAKKMQALKYVQVDTKNTAQVNKLGNEYQRLSRLQAELLGKNIQLTHSNNYLAQSFGYIRNRIVYALTLGALSRFVKELYDVRSQYELLERSLGVLVGSFERGSQIFQELNQMALKSPFTLIELSTAAKQLTAYDFAADEVVNTTRRLADISAALGVPMERLTYNLGQIRAQTVLTARDARDFANAGLPIVKELADYYSMLEGRIVSTGDVYDRMKKKMVSYEDVLTIINKVTDEGGKFFDFQAKQAETLRVQLANLSLAWNNMLNEIGKNNSKALGAPIGALKTIFENWRELSHVIGEVIVAYGSYRAYQLVINRLMGVNSTLIKKDILANKEKIAVDLQRESFTRKLSVGEKKLIATRKVITSQDYQNILSSRQLTKSQALLLVARNKNNVALTDAVVKMGLLTRAEIKNITTSKALQIQLNQVWVSLKNMMAGIASFAKANWWMLLIGALVETVHTYGEIQDQIKDINRGIVDSAKESRESIAQMLKEYADAKNRAKEGSFTDEEGAKIWERIKEEIELSSAAGKAFVERLKQIPNINQRISKGFDYLQMIHDVNGALEQIDEKAVDINGDWSKWWNLWAAPDGLVENLKEYVETLEKAKKAYGTFESAQEADQRARRQGSVTSWKWDEVQLKYNIQTTTESMVSAFQTVGITSGEAMREAFERSNQKILADANVSAKERLQYNIIAEQEFIKVRIKQFDDEYEYEKQRGNEERAERVRLEKQAWINAFGEGEVISTAFFDFLKNQHSSEVSEMFGNMSKKEIENLDWSKGRWHDWAEDMAKSFADQNDIAFDKLKKHVEDANKWKIFIQMFITSQNKTLYDELTEQDKLAQEAQSRVERLEKFISDQKKKGLANDEKTLDAIKEQTTAQNDLNDAIAKGGRLKENSKSGSKTQKDELGDTLTKELQLITDIQKLYKEYTKAGVDSETAKNAAAKEYQKTLEQTNNTLSKFGVQGLTGEKLATMDLRAMRDYYQCILDKVQSSPKAVEALEKAIRNLNVEITKEGQKTIIDSLNSELSKLKDEYELAVELDANPELGENFATMFGIVPEALPHTIEEYAERAVKSLNNHLKEGKQNLELPSLNLTPDDIKMLSQLVDEAKLGKQYYDEIIKSYNNYYNLIKKSTTDVEKYISDYIKEYGDASAQLQEIENEKNEKLKELDAIYFTEELRQTQEYLDKRQMIIDASNKKLAKTSFERLKRSDDYERFFTAIDTLTNDDALNIKNKIKQDIIDAFRKGGLTIWQFRKEIKAVEQQFDKLSKASTIWGSYIQGGFDGAINRAKELGQELEIIGEKISKDGSVSEKDQNWLSSLGNIFQTSNGQSTNFAGLMQSFGGDMQGLGGAIGKAGAGMQGAAGGFMKAVAVVDTIIKNIHGAVEGINQMMSELNEGRNEESKVGGWGWDAFSKVDQYVSSGWEKLKSGNILGAAMDTVNTFIAPIASIFRSKNKKITEQIEESERVVKRLSIAYKQLSDDAEHAYGVEVSGAQQATIENKKLQLAEAERQLALEKSRKRKFQDQDKILELQGQVEDLKLEIKNAAEDIVNDLLGISSAGDEITSLVQVMIDAFRNGEDAMDAFGKEWDKMIDNMILKLIVSQYMKTAWDEIMSTLNTKREEFLHQSSQAKANAEAQIEALKNADKVAIAVMAGIAPYPATMISEENAEKLRAALIKGYEKIIERASSELDRASQNYTEWSLDYMMNEGRQQMLDAARKLQEGIDQYYDYGELAEGQALSNLQQGIQGITEDTASALEAYMNSVSQQVYLHSDLLTQIRDAVVGFDLDVQLGVQSQMLLQLQNNYIVIQSMQSLMENWTTPAGNGIRVEVL